MNKVSRSDRFKVIQLPQSKRLDSFLTALSLHSLKIPVEEGSVGNYFGSREAGRAPSSEISLFSIKSKGGFNGDIRSFKCLFH